MAKIDPASPKVGGNRFSPEASKLAREREAKVLELRLRKVPFERIAEALGITKGAANKAFYRALRRIPQLSRTKSERKSLSLDSYRGSTLVDNRQACKPLGPRLRKSPSTAQHVLN